MKKKRLGFWDILAWAILLAILFWVILKITGVINTPLIVEYAPYIGMIYLAGWAMHKLETATENIKDLKEFNREIGGIKSKCIQNHT